MHPAIIFLVLLLVLVIAVNVRSARQITRRRRHFAEQLAALQRASLRHPAGHTPRGAR